jgi:hypothetical protein
MWDKTNAISEVEQAINTTGTTGSASSRFVPTCFSGQWANVFVDNANLHLWMSGEGSLDLVPISRLKRVPSRRAAFLPKPML